MTPIETPFLSKICSIALALGVGLSGLACDPDDGDDSSGDDANDSAMTEGEDNGEDPGSDDGADEDTGSDSTTTSTTTTSTTTSSSTTSAGDDASGACESVFDCPTVQCECPDGSIVEIASCLDGMCATTETCADPPHDACAE